MAGSCCHIWCMEFFLKMVMVVVVVVVVVVVGGVVMYGAHLTHLT